MKFWSNVEKEYNDLFGEGQDVSAEDNKDTMESDFKDMFSDIKKDLKNVPKDDLLPGLSTIKQNSESEDDDGEFDEEDAKKALKIGSARKQRKKKCKFGDKTYEVGERWKDPKTGKDMICILMNIPKEVQPKLEEADVTITKEEMKPEPEKVKTKTKKTSAKWAYTNKQPKTKGGCASDKEYEKPDQVGSEEEKLESNSKIEELAKGVNDGVERLEEKDLVEDKDETQEERTGEEGGNSTETLEKYSESKENDDKESDEISEEKEIENGVAGEKTINDNGKEDEDESESDSYDSNEERRKVLKESQSADADEESEYEEREEDKLKREYERKNPDIKVTTEDRESAVVQEVETEKNEGPPAKRPKTKLENEEGNQRNKEITESSGEQKTDISPIEEVSTIHEGEKGKTIYTKETTITQRKLFKTEETIESVETERNSK